MLVYVDGNKRVAADALFHDSVGDLLDDEAFCKGI